MVHGDAHRPFLERLRRLLSPHHSLFLFWSSNSGHSTHHGGPVSVLARAATALVSVLFFRNKWTSVALLLNSSDSSQFVLLGPILCSHLLTKNMFVHFCYVHGIYVMRGHDPDVSCLCWTSLSCFYNPLLHLQSRSAFPGITNNRPELTDNFGRLI